jgi:hypothetical protein
MNVDLRDNSTKTSVELMILENPNLSSLIAIYPEDQLDKVIANKDKLNKIISSFTNVARGGTISAIVMVCKVMTCPYRDICVLLKNGIAPEGGSCPIEKKMVMEIENETIEFLGIDRNNPIEIELLWDLIDSKILDLRASALMRSGELTNNMVTRDKDFESSKIELKPELLAKIELKKLKHSIIDAFVASRRAKKKYGANQTGNALEELLKKSVGGRYNGKTDEITDVDE